MRKPFSLILQTFLAMILIMAFVCACHHEAKNVPETFPFTLADVNSVQLMAAQEHGLSHTLKSREQIDGVSDRLVHIGTCQYYRVDKLTHSVPYLTRGASELLETIGRDFQKSLKKHKLGNYRIIVTSVLRTEEDVRRLMKNNHNAVKKSTHQYATTFDITYSRFDHISGTRATLKQLKYLLGEVLSQLREKGRCYVMHERQQPCFHITSRR
ncbi:MAG: hypothetical protein IKT00_05725 [Prevotella sp.]|nr:hypothetical protein [Prevotella sp.]